MKVFNLQCSRRHSFEGWFGSEDDFQGQLARSLIACPLCADGEIQKMPSAPRLNLGAQPAGQTAFGKAGRAAASSTAVARQAAFFKALRHVVNNTEDVGQRFADEARRMHYGDVQARNIRGQTSAHEAVELLEEGIEVMPLPMLPALNETLQ